MTKGTLVVSNCKSLLFVAKHVAVVDSEWTLWNTESDAVKKLQLWVSVNTRGILQNPYLLLKLFKEHPIPCICLNVAAQ